MPRGVYAMLIGLGSLLTPRAPNPPTLLLALICSLAIGFPAHAEPPVGARPGDEPLFSVGSPVGSIDYVAGRGLSLGRTGLHIGGFTTLELDDLSGEAAALELDSLNFLVLWEPVDFFRVFTELEIGDLFTWDIDAGETSSDPSFTVERLYADLSRSDALNLRVGKFQTPVGIWNLVPAEPFTWTANEPVLVETAFDEHQTGGAFFGSVYPGGKTLDYWLYGQFMDPLDPSKPPTPIERSVGGRLRLGGALGKWSVGSSFLASELDGNWNYLAGLDGFWERGPVEVQAEWALVRGDIPGRDLWGIYLQGVYHLGYHCNCLRSLSLVGRYEYFDPSGGASSNIYNLGLAWSPTRFLIINAGYQFTDQRSAAVDRGLFSSLSILF